MSKSRLTIGVIAGLALPALLLTSCTRESTANKHWFVDSNGHFHTNNVKLAQKEIPFTIIVPTYIPDLFVPDYLYEITGPFENTLSNYIEVDIQYTDNSHQMFISQFNKKIVMLPTEGLDPVNYEISGIQVLRQITSLIGESSTIEGLSFNWNTDGFTFEVEIFGIPENEGAKVVESMMKQIK
jgi:hypothetical protein